MPVSEPERAAAPGVPAATSMAAEDVASGPAAAPPEPPRVTFPPSDEARPEVDDLLLRGVQEEEGNLDVSAAIVSYQSAIAVFDSRRASAANAVFRLAECYRKLGRMPEAKVYYSRILREFPDQRELAELSQQKLFAGGPARGRGGNAAGYGGMSGGGGGMGGMGSGMAGMGGGGGMEGMGGRMGGMSVAGGAMHGGGGMGGGSMGVSSSELKERSEGPFRNENPEIVQLRQRASEVAEERAVAQRELMQAERRLAEQERLKRMAATSRPEHISGAISQNPEYRKAKQEYQTLLVATATDHSSEKKQELEQAAKTLQAWVERVCVPELEAASRAAAEEAEQLAQRVEDLRAKEAALHAAEAERRAKEAEAEATAGRQRR